ncbi:MAG: hypothetical protein L7F77_11375 [Candidatus Magnetominusculus sp. LBB02]|nr:hypothetical protein [Candidatus Magnetominusculus sp. LBB02]
MPKLMWIDILRRRVESSSAKIVARDLGYSRATVALVLSGKYKGNLKNIEQRVMSIYGNNGRVACPILGEVAPAKCIDTWQMSKTIGMKASNPETLRLYKACEKCGVRN